MRQVAFLLMMIAIAIASPILIPIAFALHVRDLRRMRAVANKTRCEDCDAILGEVSLRRADIVWAEQIAAHDRYWPGIRRRRMRCLWAICAACDTEYGFDAALGVFRPLKRSLPQDR